MKPTIEQLNMLNDYELNCAVAEKRGFKLYDNTKCADGAVNIDLDNRGVHGALPCSTRNWVNLAGDYMSIAIEYCIDIEFHKADKTVQATNEGHNYTRDNEIQTSSIPKDQTGRAVCIAFLLMQTE